MSMIFVECKLVLPKSREVFIKLPSTYRVCVDFIKIRGSFVKLTFTSLGALLQKCHIWTVR